MKGVYFLQNANNLNFKLFFRLYTWPTKQVFCLYLRIILDNKSFWMYCSLNQSFWRLKKSSTSCPNWGGKYFCSLSQFRPLSLPQPLPSFLSWELGESDIELKCWLTYGRRLCAAVCILTCCCCLCLGKHHCWADTGERQEKNLRLKIFYFPTFCCGQSHFNNDNEKTQHTIKNNFCNKRENPT